MGIGIFRRSLYRLRSWDISGFRATLHLTIAARESANQPRSECHAFHWPDHEDLSDNGRADSADGSQISHSFQIEVQTTGGRAFLEISQDAAVELREALALYLQARGFP